MKYHLKYILLFIVIFSFFSSKIVNANNNTILTGAIVQNQDFLSKIEKNIAPNSPSSKIIKLQNLFSELKLYSGAIDGDFNSIKETLINYQVSAGIIKGSGAEDAGYFGKKTISSLKKDYFNFEEIASRTLKLDEVLPPAVGPRMFTVTAYYSPLPGQKKYLKGNYDDEIKLNGKGIHGASGKPVFSGMLAGPINYKFGTKVYIEGLGIGSVEDRGSAIVSSGNRGYENDRIDVWMGYGDEGLNRATKWGKQTVKGEVLENTAQVTMKFDDNRVVISDKTKKQLENIKEKILTYVDKKYPGNNELKEKYKTNLKNTLNKYIAQVEDNDKKEQLIYLRAIL